MIFPARKSHPLDSVAREIRLTVLDMIKTAGFGHLGGVFSATEILVSLYSSPLFNFDRDHFILSAGHLCLLHYAILAHFGRLNPHLLSTYSELGSSLQGHESISTPGVEYSSGSLGQGLSFAAGMALSDRTRHVICLTTDGEHDEGQIWEAAAFAQKYHLGNLINIIDVNGFQIGGSTEDIMPKGDLAAKYLRFGWTVITVNGHNFNALKNALEKSKNSTIYPACIIAKTTMGKGVSFMENTHLYHDIKSLSPALYLQAKNELGS